MSGDGFEARKGARPQDPVWRFVAGCAMVAAGLALILFVFALFVGWRLARDETPGRPPETFLVGDEARYWCVALKPHDAGLISLFARLGEINDATRRNVFRGTILESVPLPHRKPRLEELAPFSFELSMSANDPGQEGKANGGWAARGTFSHNLFRMRAALRVIRFIASRDVRKAETVDIDGISVTVVEDGGAGFAVSTVGNRVLVTSDAARMRMVLRPAADVASGALADVLAAHDAIKLAGEDAWAFYANRPPMGVAPLLTDHRALASFDVNDRDELVFRVVVSAGHGLEGGGAFAGSPADCSAVVSRFLPGIPQHAIAIDGDGARLGDSGMKEFSGRIAGLSTRLTELLSGVTVIRRSGTPFAIPTPPSPEESVDPRNETLAGPRHEGTPTPRR